MSFLGVLDEKLALCCRICLFNGANLNFICNDKNESQEFLCTHLPKYESEDLFGF